MKKLTISFESEKKYQEIKEYFEYLKQRIDLKTNLDVIEYLLMQYEKNN